MYYAVLFNVVLFSVVCQGTRSFRVFLQYRFIASKARLRIAECSRQIMQNSTTPIASIITRMILQHRLNENHGSSCDDGSTDSCEGHGDGCRSSTSESVFDGAEQHKEAKRSASSLWCAAFAIELGEERH